MGFKLSSLAKGFGLSYLIAKKLPSWAGVGGLVGNQIRKEEKDKKQKAQANALFEERTAQAQEAAATEGRRKRKMAELEEGKEKVTGFSSLIGKGDSLG